MDLKTQHNKLINSILINKKTDCCPVVYGHKAAVDVLFTAENCN